MNFLAHIYLSGDNDLLKIGNFMADSVHGKRYLDYVDDLQSIAAIFRVVTDKDDLIVKDEFELSGSSSSESGSPKDKKM